MILETLFFFLELCLPNKVKFKLFNISNLSFEFQSRSIFFVN